MIKLYVIVLGYLLSIWVDSQINKKADRLITFKTPINIIYITCFLASTYA